MNMEEMGCWFKVPVYTASSSKQCILELFWPLIWNICGYLVVTQYEAVCSDVFLNRTFHQKGQSNYLQSFLPGAEHVGIVGM